MRHEHTSRVTLHEYVKEVSPGLTEHKLFSHIAVNKLFVFLKVGLSFLNNYNTLTWIILQMLVKRF